MRSYLFTCLAFLQLLILAACSAAPPPQLTIMVGRGLKKPMEEVRAAFTEQTGISTNVVYAGSGVLLATIKRSEKGDVFIPGSLFTMEKAGDLVNRKVPVVLHTPVIAVATANPRNITSLADLAQPGIRVGIANKEMAALGRTSEEVFATADLYDAIMANVIIKTQTVIVLLDHLANNELDAALLWSDMLLWPEAKGVKGIAIGPEVTRTKQIYAGQLRHSKYPKEAGLFIDFIAREGALIFQRYGFEAMP